MRRRDSAEKVNRRVEDRGISVLLFLFEQQTMYLYTRQVFVRYGRTDTIRNIGKKDENTLFLLYKCSFRQNDDNCIRCTHSVDNSKKKA